MSWRLLTEDEVDRFKASDRVVPGQCHATESSNGESDTFCHNRRSGFRRTCDEHRGLQPFRDPNEKGQDKPA